jgi:hypothetical protein
MYSVVGTAQQNFHIWLVLKIFAVVPAAVYIFYVDICVHDYDFSHNV